VFCSRADESRVYVPAIFVLNKIDAISIEELDLLYKVSNWRIRFTTT
jgi:ribosome-interacting GTPase 1